MHRITLEDDHKNSSYSIGKDENPHSPGQNFEALAHSKYSTIEEKDRKLYCSNSYQVKNAARKTNLEDDEKPFLNDYIATYLNIED